MTTEPTSDKLFTAEETALLRRQYIEKMLIPVLENRFQRFPQLLSAALFVGQFWNDEADDAVHPDWIFSVLGTPDWGSAFEDRDYPEDPINLPDLPPHCDLAWEIGGVSFPFDDNGLAIPLFASFCREGANQGMDFQDAFSLFAIFRKTEAGIEVEYRGEMLRPWLEGIRPEYFQRFPEFERTAIDQLRKNTTD